MGSPWLPSGHSYLRLCLFVASFCVGLVVCSGDSPWWTLGRHHRDPHQGDQMDTVGYVELEENSESNDESSAKSLLYNKHPMPSAKINLYPKSALRAVEVELIYDESLFPGGFKVSLMMDPNGTAIDCADPTSLRKIRDSCKPSKSINHHINCENLQPGLYCARAHESLPDGKYGHLFYTEMKRLDENAGAVAGSMSAPQHSDTGKIVSLCLGIGCSIVALVLLGLLVINKRYKMTGTNSPPFESKLELIDAIRNEPSVRVYLMYYPECCHHVNFVEFLAKFLSNNNCEVSYDLKEVNSIAVNAASWIQRKLSGRYKILVINSKSGFEQQKLWLDNAGVVIEETASSEANIFLSALAKIMHDAQQAFDYSTVYMLRPSYVSKRHLLRNVCPGKQYEIPADLNHLVGHLHDLDPQRVRLDAYPSDIWKHCATSYDNLLRQARDIAGTDAPTEISRFAGNCHACNTIGMSASADVIRNEISERLLVM